jgi:beta-xylosidase
MKYRVHVAFTLLFLIGIVFNASSQATLNDSIISGYSGNPIIRHIFTADPAALVYNDTFYIYAGHDEQEVGNKPFLIKDWHVFSSSDMINWKDHGAVLSLNDFSWAVANAWAGQCIYRDGKFWWYVPMSHRTKKGFAIGVAVSDSPTGPFKDARGSAIITNDMTTQVDIDWDDIDPAVFIDNDGQAYLFWGNTRCKYIKLKKNMIETEGPIDVIDLPHFTEAPYVHKRGDIYYLSYASEFPECIDYATSKNIKGPWKYQGRINDTVPNSPTNHQSIVAYKGNWYFVYHNGALPTGGEFRRSVCIDRLNYNEDGTIQKIVQTKKGVSSVNGIKMEPKNK